MKYAITVVIILITLLPTSSGRDPMKGEKFRIAFWNLENLFDTINNPAIFDNEFTPTGSQKWNTQKYLTKAERILEVIQELQPDIMGICEVENEKVIEDILPHGYRYIHYDSPDSRGIDVAMIYNDNRISVLKSEPIKAYGSRKTRDILRVDALLIREKEHSSNSHTTKSTGISFTLLVTHLPSRRGNDPESSRQRKTIVHQIDSIAKESGNVIIMGDFNQNPAKDLLPDFYNTTAESYNQGKGSYAYRDRWQMYDQIFVDYGRKAEATVHRKGLTQTTGRFKGYPSKGNPSDHFPVYVDITP